MNNVALSNWMAQHARASPLLAGNEVCVIPNGIDVQRFAPGAAAGLRYDDPALAIPWPLRVTHIADQDRNWPLLAPHAEAQPAALP